MYPECVPCGHRVVWSIAAIECPSTIERATDARGKECRASRSRDRASYTAGDILHAVRAVLARGHERSSWARA